MKLKSYQLLLLSILSGIIWSLGWMEISVGPVLFIAFVPLLFVEHQLYEQRHTNRSVKAFLYAMPAFIVLYLISIWGTIYASITGLILLTVTFSMFMSIAFWLFHIAKRIVGPKMGYFAFITFWLTYEYFNVNGEISFPTYNLGNGFGFNSEMVQWYEFTGAFGGSLWILLVNLLLFQIGRNIISRNSFSIYRGLVIMVVIVLAVPISWSYYRYNTYTEKRDPREIVVLQPNLDPYTEKFDGIPMDRQMGIMFSLASKLVTRNTDYVVGPETAIPTGMWLDQIDNDKYIRLVKTFVKDYPKIKFVLGVNSNQMYPNKDSASATAHQYRDTEMWYDFYNTALQVDTSSDYQYYHKSKLTTGAEKMPYSDKFKFMENLVMDLGGQVGSNGTQKERSLLISKDDTTKVGTIICFESVFGEFVSEFVRNGAELLFIITNDGWWGESHVYKQHLAFARLRAIESRRSIARSANTGVSCFVNQRGDIIEPTEYGSTDARIRQINCNDEITFYVKTGDYIPKIAFFFSIIIVLYAIVSKLKNKRQNY